VGERALVRLDALWPDLGLRAAPAGGRRRSGPAEEPLAGSAGTAIGGGTGPAPSAVEPRRQAPGRSGGNGPPRSAGWVVDNRGEHTLRRVLVVSSRGRAAPLPDLAPGARLDVPVPVEPASEPPALAVWRTLLPPPDGPRAGAGATASPGPARPPDGPDVLLATLDPPLPSLRVEGAHFRAASSTRLVLVLPGEAAP
jgi:hypothetical protein